VIKLLQGDCLELMKSIPDDSIDLVLTDPPYGTTACKWDSIIDLELMWVELKRITKSNSAIVLMASQPFTTKLISSNYEMFKYCWVWEKTISPNFAVLKYRPAKLHEDIVVFTKKTIKYYPIMKNGKSYNDKKRPTSRIDGILKNTLPESQAINNKGTRYPSSVIKISNGNNDNVHETQKPVALMEYLIKTYTKENELVLDFTMGSGTTGVACKLLNRNFIGIELDKKYFEIAEKRIKSKYGRQEKYNDEHDIVQHQLF